MLSPSLRPQTANVWDLVKRFLPYLRRVRWQSGLSTGLVLVNPVVAASLLWSAKLLIDNVFVGGQIELLPTFAVVYAALLTVNFVLGYAVERLEAAIVEQISLDVRWQLAHNRLVVNAFGARRSPDAHDRQVQLRPARGYGPNAPIPQQRIARVSALDEW